MRRTLALFALLSGCGTSPANPDGGEADMTPPPDLARPPLGAPIDAPKNAWTWVDFPDAVCDDGSPSGIGLNPGDGANLLVFLMGGGACWDYATCFTYMTAARGPFGKPQFDASIARFPAGSVFDRNATESPFRDWSFVFVPYCTGDVHGGDKVMAYADGMGGTRMYHHKGHANVVAFLKRLAATFPAPPKLVVTGSSAGGFGASFNYATFRAYFPGGQAYLVDDSGPVFVGDDIPPVFRDEWYASWGLGALLDADCPTCRTDLSAGVRATARRYPKDRMALLSSLQDRTIRTYFLATAMEFETRLLKMAGEVLDPEPNFGYFFVSGDSHTMLGSPGRFASGGTALNAWLKQQVTDDPAWTSVKP